MKKLFLAVLLIPSMVYAQAGKAELFGIVRDASALPLPGAKVEAREQSTGVQFSALTSGRGQYHLLGLPAGRYRVAVEHPGFKTYQRSGLELRIADRIALDVRLELGEVHEEVRVTAEAPLLQADSAAVAQTTSQRQIVTLPLDGRNFIPLVALLPGVALPPGSAFPRINGSRPRTSEYLYDGISVLQPEPGQVAWYPVLDAIQEFRVDVNDYSPEYGRSNGGVIQVIHKSGGNEYHGALFEFFRHESLNARNLFASGEEKPLFRRNQYGFVFGGPLERNKFFFFADYQGTRLRTGVPRISTVPTDLERQGIFPEAIYDPAAMRPGPGGFVRDPFPNHTIPASRFDPAALEVIRRYPFPDRGAAANNYLRSGVETEDQNQADLRLDRYFGPRHRVFARYSFLRDLSRPVAPLPDGSGDLTSGTIGDTLTRAAGFAAEHDWNLSASTLNQLRFGYTRRGFDRNALRTGQPPLASTGVPNIPGNAFFDALPTFQVAGYQQIGPPANANSRFATSVTEFLDTFSTLRGAHSLKAGGDIRLEHLDVLQPPDPTGLFQFTVLSTNQPGVAGTGNSSASLLLGQVNSFQMDLQNEALQPRARIAEFFFGDDWKASPRLSLNLGVRYTLNFPSTEARDRGAIFNLASQQLDFLGRNGYPRTARKLEKGDFGPRLGAAYRLGDSLVARAGYGLIWFEQAGITTPFTIPQFPFIQTVSQRSLDNVSPAFILSQGPTVDAQPPNPDSGLGQGVFSIDRNSGSGYAQQWNVSLQKTLARNLSLEVGYLGSKLTRLGAPDTNLNQLPAALLGLGPQLLEAVPNPYYGAIPASSSLGGPTLTRQQLLRPYPRFTTVSLFRDNIGQSVYHALQAHLEKRFSSGLTFTLSYTFSKLIDDASSVFDAAVLTGPVANYPVADSFNRHLERDVSAGDIPHVFSAGYVYQLPKGWEIAGIVRLQSGLPVAVTQQPNYNSFAGFGAERPNRVADPALASPSLARWFNTDAFRIAPQFTIGNSSRNPVRGPGYQAADLMVGKTFAIGDRLRTEFRAEAFNVANTPPLGSPNGVLGTPAFGSITSAGDPRVFELVVKLHF